MSWREILQHAEVVSGAAVGSFVACRLAHADLKRALEDIKAATLRMHARLTAVTGRIFQIEQHPAISIRINNPPEV